MINAPPWLSSERAKTERAAIKGWGPTLRLVTLRATPIVLWALAVLAFHHWA